MSVNEITKFTVSVLPFQFISFRTLVLVLMNFYTLKDVA